MDMKIEVNRPTLMRYADGTTDFYNPASYPTTLSMAGFDVLPSYIKSVDHDFRAWCSYNGIGMTDFRGVVGSLCTLSGRTEYAQDLLDRQFV